MLRKGILLVVSGPSGAGKSTLCKTIVAQVSSTILSVSYTTRGPRPGEQNGIDYCFTTEDQFRELIQQEEFIEWAEVYGNLYGTPKSCLLQSINQGTDVLLDIDAQGARQIVEKFPEAVYVFVTPPSLKVLRVRLNQRASDSTKEIQQRLQRASNEIGNYRSYHYLIRNEELTQATKELEAIILAERIRTERFESKWLMEKGLIENNITKEPSASMRSSQPKESI